MVSLSYKFIAVKGGEALLREGLNSGVGYLSSMSMDILRPHLLNSVHNAVRLKFCQPELFNLNRKILSIDRVSSTKTNIQMKIDYIIMEILSPQLGFWDQIGIPLLKGILADPKYLGSGFSMGLRIFGTLKGLSEMSTLVDYVYIELVRKLSQFNKNSMTMKLTLAHHLKIDKKTAENVSLFLKKENIVDLNEYLAFNNDDDLIKKEEIKIKIRKISNENYEKILGLSKNQIVKLIKFLDQYVEVYAEFDIDCLSVIIKSVSDKISDQLIRTIESKLITPWATLATSKVTEKISTHIQHNYLCNKEQTLASQNESQNKYDLLKNKPENELTDKEKEFITNFGEYNTIGKQIGFNAKDYSIAYQQCEIDDAAIKISEKQKQQQQQKSTAVQTESKTNKTKIDEYAEGVRTKNKAATLAEQRLAADMNDLDVKQVDDKNYKPTEDDIKNNRKIILIQPGGIDEKGVAKVGHAYCLDNKSGQWIGIKTSAENKNNCYYDTKSYLLAEKGVNKTSQQLRD